MKKIFTLALVIFVSLSSVALAKKPVKIARLPIIIQQNKLEKETSVELEMKIARAVKVPMSNTLKDFEYFPPKESAQALNKIWQKMYSENKKAQISDALKILADDIGADLVICPILHHYHQRVSPLNVSFETHLSSSVAAELIIYDRNTGELIDKDTSRYFSNHYHRLGTASYLAGECFDQLIKETDLRQIIRSKKG